MPEIIFEIRSFDGKFVAFLDVCCAASSLFSFAKPSKAPQLDV